MRYRNCLRISICLVLMGWSMAVDAAVRLPAVIGDNMVLQRGQPVPIWGWADEGEEVTVCIAGQTVSTKADGDGRWKVLLDNLKLGQPQEMTVKGSTGNTITLKNILVGEVWLCSGQSNMELGVASCNNASEEIAAADYLQIRLLSVPLKGTQKPQHDFKGRWVDCNSKTVKNFSAAAYYFGRKLHNQLNVPIGLIHCSWGASSCEAWIKRSVLESDLQYQSMLQSWDDRMRDFAPRDLEEAEQKYAAWRKRVVAAKASGEPQPTKPKNLQKWINQMFGVRRRPANCYNGMLLPLIPYAIRGVIWYQGETNAERAYQYRRLFPLMIGHWREEWNQGDFPFYFVQLANFKAAKPTPGDSSWAELREAQAMALGEPNTGMAVTIDIGNAKDIHPKNKQDVGGRLARWALAKTYGRDIVYSGPLYKSMGKRNNRIVIHFDYIGTGLTAKGGGRLKGFAIAGHDKQFVWAEADIIGDTIVVSSPDIPDPVAVRYAWADNPECNLYNREGLPASPFRTDSWKGITE